MTLGNLTKITLTEDNIASASPGGKIPSQLTIPDGFPAGKKQN